MKTTAPPDEAPALTRSDSVEAYIRRRADALWRAAWLLTADEGKAEDLVQTALSKTWHRFVGFDNDHHFESYVRTTMYRTYCSWWRRAQARSEVLTDDVGDWRPTAELSTEDRIDMLHALGSLNRTQRTILVMRYYDDRSVADVAEALGIPQNTVKTHARRAIAKIRESVHLQLPEDLS